MNLEMYFDNDMNGQFVGCAGIEVELGMFSGCSGGDDCPVCQGTGRVINCPRCSEPTIVISNGSIGCLSCGMDYELEA